MISKLKTNEWILLTLFVASPLYFHANVGGTGFRIPNNIVIWLTASSFICWSLFHAARRKTFSLPNNYLGILTFPIIAWFSSIFADVEMVNQWLLRMLFLWAGVVFFFALFQQKFRQSHWDRILFFILIAGFLHSLVGLAQIIFTTQLPNWLPTNPNGAPTGLFQQINNQASFQVTVLIAAFWLNTRPTISHAPLWRYIFSLIVIALSCFIVAYSGSRVGALSFLIATPLFVVSRWQQIKQQYARWLLILMVMITAITLANVIEQQRGLMSVAQKTAAINSGYSASARLGIYSISLDLIKEKPLFGHGVGSFVRVWQNKKPAFYEEHPDATLPNQRVSHPHNELMFWLVEAGLLTGFGLLVLFVSTLVALLKLPHCRRYAYIALLVPVSLHTQVELPFYISSLHWFLFLTLLAFVLTPNHKTIALTLSSAAQKSIRILALSLMILSTVFLLHSFKASLELKQYATEKYASTESMQTALTNPYFKEMATNLVMLSMYKTSVLHNIESNIELFADWAEQTIPYDPHPLFFELAVKANLHLNKGEKACRFNAMATQMYPQHAQFKKIGKQCSHNESEHIKQ